MAQDVWYPSCWVELTLDLDDFITEQLTPVPPGLGDPVDNSKGYTFTITILPRDVSIERNSYRKADECEVTIPHSKLPVRPEFVRAAYIRVFAGALSPNDHADLHGTTPPGPIAVVPETDLNGSNEVFRGFVDDWELSMQEGTEDVTITARDITAIAIDARLPVDAMSGIPKVMPIDVVIREILVGNAATAGILPDVDQQRANRKDARRAVQSLNDQLSALQTKLPKATAAGDDATVARLNVEIADITTRLASAEAIAAVGDSVPVLAARYGLPEFRGLQVVNATLSPVLPAIGDVKGVDWFDSKGTAKRKGRSRSWGTKKESYWDIITDMVVGAGYICYFGPHPLYPVVPGGPPPPAVLIIDEPSTYYKTLESANPNIHTFTYGENLETIEIRREIRGQRSSFVVVQAIEDVTGRHITAQYPPGRSVNRRGQATPAAVPGAGNRQEFKTFNIADRIPGTQAAVTLARMARSIYEQLARGDLRVSVETSRLSTRPFNAGLSMVDMFELLPGRPCRVRIRPEDNLTIESEVPVVTTAGAWTALPPDVRAQYLVEVAGLPPAVAAVFATQLSSDRATDIYYTHEVRITWNQDTGFDFKVEAINYLDATSDLAAIEQAAAAAQAITETTLEVSAALNPLLTT